MNTTRRTTTAFLLLLALALSSCAAGAKSLQGEQGGSTTSTGPAVEQSAQAGATAATVLVSKATVHSAPSESSKTVASLSDRTEFGSPRTFLVVDAEAGWVQVMLPTRPNGSTGWVRADDVDLADVHHLVSVELEERRLTVFEDGTPVMQTDIAVGSSQNPTPAGTHYVTDLVVPQGTGAYGPFAFGLSGHSDTLSEFGGGDGQIGVHGTNDPSSIGEAVSHGCIRVPNDVVSAMADMIPLGTPVVVT